MEYFDAAHVTKYCGTLRRGFEHHESLALDYLLLYKNTPKITPFLLGFTNTDVTADNNWGLFIKELTLKIQNLTDA